MQYVVCVYVVSPVLAVGVSARQVVVCCWHHVLSSEVSDLLVLGLLLVWWFHNTKFDRRVWFC